MGQPATSGLRADGFEFHEELLPISLLVTHRTLTAEDAPRVFEYYRSLCRRRIRFVAVCDVRAARAVPDAQTRQRFAEEVARFAEDAATWSIGSIMVVESPSIRGALTAIQWLRRPTRPISYLTDLGEAIAWAATLLDARDIPLTPAIREFLRAHGHDGPPPR